MPGVLKTPEPQNTRVSYDPKYEFEAPHFKDFTEESPINSKVDSWFDQQTSIPTEDVFGSETTFDEVKELITTESKPVEPVAAEPVAAEPVKPTALAALAAPAEPTPMESTETSTENVDSADETAVNEEQTPMLPFASNLFKTTAETNKENKSENVPKEQPKVQPKPTTATQRKKASAVNTKKKTTVKKTTKTFTRSTFTKTKTTRSATAKKTKPASTPKTTGPSSTRKTRASTLKKTTKQFKKPSSFVKRSFTSTVTPKSSRATKSAISSTNKFMPKFNMQTRSMTTPKRSARALTKVKPFSFSTGRRTRATTRTAQTPRARAAPKINTSTRKAPSSARRHPTKRKLTTAQSPTLSKRARHGSVMSSEDRELAEIEAKREKLRQFRAKTARGAENMGYGGQVLPVRSTSELTEPQEFSFATTARSARKAGRTSSLTPAATPSPRRTRSTARGSITKTKPFNLTTSHRSTHSSQSSGSEFMSFQEKMNKFNTDLSTRQTSAPSPVRKHVTIAKEFNLSTTDRMRPDQVLTTEERQLQEMANAKPFKAREFKPAQFSSLGVSRTTCAAPTVTKEFHLSSGRQTSSAGSAATTPTKKFVPLAFNKKLFDGPDPRKQVRLNSARKRKQITVSEFNLTASAKKRARAASDKPFEPFKARPLPNMHKKFSPVRSHAKLTIAQPFNLSTEVRGQHKVQKLMEQETEAEIKRQSLTKFHARPIMHASTTLSQLSTTKPTKESTQFVPFDLKSVELSDMFQAKFQKQQEVEVSKEEQARTFRARDPTVLKQQPFVAQPSNKPLTQTMDLLLKSTSRAIDRSEFDAEKEARAGDKEIQKKHQKDQENAQKASEIKTLRENLVHKAKPFVHSSPMKVRHSMKKLTVAMSPLLQTKARAKSNMNNIENSSFANLMTSFR